MTRTIRRSLLATLLFGGFAVRALAQDPTPAAPPAASPTPAPAAPVPSTPAAPGPLVFSEVVPVEGATKAALYTAALVWFSEAVKQPSEALSTQDRDAGIVVGKSSFAYEPVVFVGSSGIRGTVRFSITVEVKDGRYRYSLSSFTHEGNPRNPGGNFAFGLLTSADSSPEVSGISEGGRKKTWAHLKELAQKHATELAASLKVRMAGAKTTEW